MSPLTLRPAAASRPSPEPGLVRAAFRELHGARLHGFALLVTLGDRQRAARMASDALAAGVQRASDLRHPERAAAWLRARALRLAQRQPLTARRVIAPRERLAVLAELGVDAAGYRALAVLDVRERAALVAAEVERLDELDVATVLGADERSVRRLLKRARRRHAAAFATALGDLDPVPGPIAMSISAAAGRALR